MTVSVGYSAEEIGDFVRAYESQPYGTKLSWLADQGVSHGRLRRWTEAVHFGDVLRGMVPRDDVHVSESQGIRRLQSKAVAAERAAHAAQLAALQARVNELEAVNDALGKAIGLLHQMSEQEPDENQGPGEPPAS